MLRQNQWMSFVTMCSFALISAAPAMAYQLGGVVDGVNKAANQTQGTVRKSSSKVESGVSSQGTVKGKNRITSEGKVKSQTDVEGEINDDTRIKGEVDGQGRVTRKANYRQGDDSRVDDARSSTQQGRDQRRDQRPQAWMGVTLDDAQDRDGITVGRIYPSGPASRAGLRGNDVIISANGKSVANSEEFYQHLNNAQPGQEMDLTVMRNGEERTVTITPGNRSDYIGPRYERGYDQDRRMSDSREFDDRSQMMSHNGDIPEHSMMLEQHRRLAEQHQRIEERLDRVIEELEALRKQMASSKQNR